MATLFTDHTSTRHGQGKQPTRTELLEQLDRIVSSNHFRNSKRYPSFLRFIVEHTVAEDTEVLKERNLGTEVFGRPSDYDTNADPIVRVTAGEVRKRIAQYYHTAGHEDEVRIDLPLGSYVPHFYPSSHAAEARAADQFAIEHREHVEEAAAAAPMLSPPVEHEAAPPAAVEAVPVKVVGSRTKRWRLGLYGIATIALTATLLTAAISSARLRSRRSGTEFFWQAFTSTSNNALIVIGVHFLDSTGKTLPTDSDGTPVHDRTENALSSMQSSDMVPLSDIVSYSKLTDLLTRRSLAYRTKGSADTTFDELRPGPVILIGGFDNIWTMRLTSRLRYRFMPRTADVNAIVDSQHPSTAWLFDNLQPVHGNSRDYAIVASYFDTTIEQHVLIVAGIGKSGTITAAEFLTTDRHMKSWLDEARIPPNRNVELVLSTEVLDGEPGPPHVVAYTTW